MQGKGYPHPAKDQQCPEEATKEPVQEDHGNNAKWTIIEYRRAMMI